MLDRLTSRFVVLLLANMLAAFPVFADAPVALVEAGAPKAVVVAGPSAAEQDAAGLLADFVRRMSGAELPVHRVPEGAMWHQVENGHEGMNIVVVAEALAAQLGFDSEGLGPGGVRLATFEKGVVVLGGPVRARGFPGADDSGVRYAAVELLEQLGCRYLWPGELGLVVPQKRDIAVGPMDYRYTPPIPGRFVRYREGRLQSRTRRGLARVEVSPEEWREGYRKALGDLDLPDELWDRARLSRIAGSTAWSDWNRLSSGGLPRFGHAAAGLSPSGGWEAHGEAHPEWFALQRDGTRDQSGVGNRYRLCKSNPDLIEFVANDIIRRVHENPDTRLVSLFPNDGGYSSWCMCDDCVALDPPEAPTVEINIFHRVGSGARDVIEHPSLSDRLVYYWNSIAERVTEVHPDLLLGISAYSRNRHPPVRRRVHPNLVVCSTSHEVIRGWQEVGARRAYWRPNLMQPSRRSLMIRSFVGYFSEIIRFLSEEAGVVQTDIDSFVHNWAMHGWSYYAVARLLWDPATPPDDIIVDFAKHGFGAGWEHVTAYIRELEFMAEEGDFRQAFTSEATARLRGLLNEAERAADDPVVSERIAFLRLALNFSELQQILSEKESGEREVDRVLQRRLRDLNALASTDIALNHNLALDTGYFYSRRAHPGGADISDPDLLERARMPEHGLTGREQSVEDMLNAFGL